MNTIGELLKYKGIDVVDMVKLRRQAARFRSPHVKPIFMDEIKVKGLPCLAHARELVPSFKVTKISERHVASRFIGMVKREVSK